jgi:hypothetical protein
MHRIASVDVSLGRHKETHALLVPLLDIPDHWISRGLRLQAAINSDRCKVKSIGLVDNPVAPPGATVSRS